MQNWLTPPLFENTEKQRYASITHVISLTLIVAAVLGAAVVGLKGEVAGSLAILCGAILVLGAHILNQQGRVGLAAFLVVFAVLILASVLIALGNGIHDIAIMLYPVELILASVLLNRRGFLAIVALTVLSMTSIIILEVNGIIVTPFSTITNYDDIVILSIIIIITSVGLRLLADNLNQSIRQALHNEQVAAEINQRLQAQAEERSRRIQRIEQQQAALVELATFDAVIQGDLERAFRHVTEVLARVVNVERSSIWLLDDARQLMHCRDLYHKSKGIHSTGPQFTVSSFPLYFEAMQSSQALVIADAWSDLRVKELGDSYLKLLGIQSKLDGVIRLRGELVGVVSCEQIGDVREWQEDEVAFLSVVADQATQSILNHERNQAEESVRQLNAELEQRVTQRTAELEAKARELETFAYSVAHDLKAPLRGIDGYSKLLLEDSGHLLNEDGKYFLGTIRSATDRMNQLINDLLAYSRLERREVVITPVRLSELLQQILDEKSAELHERHVEVRIHLPYESIDAEPEGLVQVLRNLIDNAVKFTREVAEPCIEVGGSTQTDGCVMWVKDNGIGFDMKFHERIFEIFQRLHRIEDYPGTGIGLALVRKAIQRMGGRVWAESEPGNGATFYLFFPAQKPEVEQ